MTLNKANVLILNQEKLFSKISLVKKLRRFILHLPKEFVNLYVMKTKNVLHIATKK